MHLLALSPTHYRERSCQAPFSLTKSESQENEKGRQFQSNTLQPKPPQPNPHQFTHYSPIQSSLTQTSSIHFNPIQLASSIHVQYTPAQSVLLCPFHREPLQFKGERVLG